EIKERVVASERDDEHQEREGPKCDESRAPRKKDEKRRSEFDTEHCRAGDFLEPEWEMVRIPGQRRWQRLGFVMEREGNQVVPTGIATQQLHGARGEHQPEQQPTQQPENNSRRGRFAREVWPQSQWREKDGQEACFEQQVVPLVTEEDCADRRQREVK